ncbi:hypothetical protein Mpe_B0596 (plasmid) [Methylibium petroleiphilum PM1]|uniref:Uncharacterized protein n=1 Tax=Methylibium petroleiphilum (strain ATCC BAA-1232 / LMG 22953 / PM1) TaxID=420662 RepID=A2SP71_METPP|nr:hypothetical protein Mpe_B0596 [Methylibium petroleiphilum PM1]
MSQARCPPIPYFQVPLFSAGNVGNEGQTCIRRTTSTLGLMVGRRYPHSAERTAEAIRDSRYNTGGLGRTPRVRGNGQVASVRSDSVLRKAAAGQSRTT